MRSRRRSAYAPTRHRSRAPTTPTRPVSRRCRAGAATGCARRTANPSTPSSRQTISASSRAHHRHRGRTPTASGSSALFDLNLRRLDPRAVRITTRPGGTAPAPLATGQSSAVRSRQNPLQHNKLSSTRSASSTPLTGGHPAVICTRNGHRMSFPRPGWCGAARLAKGWLAHRPMIGIYRSCDRRFAGTHVPDTHRACRGAPARLRDPA